MKYFNPSYWFKLWLLSAPLFNYKTQGTQILEKNKNKEINLYYDSDKKENIIIHFSPSNSITVFSKIYTFPMGDNMPTKYNKLQFLGNIFSDGWGTRVKWGNWIYDPNHINNKGINSDLLLFMTKRDDNLTRDILYNEKVNSNTIPKYLSGKLQTVNDYDTFAWVGGSQSFGLSWYEENYTYFFQVYFYQNLDWRASYASLDCYMKIGKGIRLYNDDNTLKTQISNPNDRKRREIYKEKNINKWTDKFTNSINNEQHLPITNNTNFVTNNITSL